MALTLLRGSGPLCTRLFPVGSPLAMGYILPTTTATFQNGAPYQQQAAPGSASASADPRGLRPPPPTRGVLFLGQDAEVCTALWGEAGGGQACTSVWGLWDRLWGRGGHPETASKTCSPVGRATGLAVVHRAPGALPPAPRQLRAPPRAGRGGVASEPLVLLVLKQLGQESGGSPRPHSHNVCVAVQAEG